MSKKHGLLMIIGCLVPIIAAAVIIVFKIPIKNMLVYLLFLLCPLSHLLMMGSMKHDRQEHHQASELTIDVTPKNIE